MRCYLINPDYPEKHRLLFPVPPLGLAYIAAIIEESGHSVTVEDQFASGISNAALAERIMGVQPDIIGIGSLTPSIKHACQLVKMLRCRGYGGTIFMGNIHPSLFAAELLKEVPVDIVVHGEGEITVSELLKALQTGLELRHVNGITFRDADGSIVSNPRREQISELDALPYPAWHLFDLNPYAKHPMLMMTGLYLPVQGSRGCERRCVFCAQEMFTPRVYLRSPENVIREIEHLHRLYDIKYAAFIDANFPVDTEFGTEFMRLYKKSTSFNRVQWICQTRVDMVRPEILNEMKKSGCYLVQYGFESGDARVLRDIRKKTSLDHGLYAMKYTKKAGLKSLGLFMIGLPGERLTQIFRTFFYAQRLDCDMVKFNIAIPLPGSRLFEDIRDKLMADFHPETFSSWYRPEKGGPPMTITSDVFTSGQLHLLQTLGMILYYFRPRMIFRHLFRGNMKFSDILQGIRFLVFKS